MRKRRRRKDHGYSRTNQAVLLSSGDPYFHRLFQRIDEARDFIHIQVYILGDDVTGHRFLNHLKAALLRGLEVFLMIDHFGTPWLTNEKIKDLLDAGLIFKRFSRRMGFHNFRLGRRLHSKIAIIDNRFAFIGGLNIADRYSGFDGAPAWLDYAVELEGAVVPQINRTASAYWKRRIRRVLRSYPVLPHPSPTGAAISVKAAFNDWLRNQFGISQGYRDAIQQAQKEIWIIAAYFIPTPRLLKLILDKARQGVAVRMLFSGESDVPLMKAAMEYYYPGLIRAGVELYEWKKSVLHAKLILTDGDWMSIGSYNLNQLSDFGSLEANVEIKNADFVSRVKQQLITDIQPFSIRVQEIKRSWTASLLLYLSFLSIRISLKILFLTSRRKLL